MYTKYFYYGYHVNLSWKRVYGIDLWTATTLQLTTDKLGSCTHTSHSACAIPIAHPQHAVNAQNYPQYTTTLIPTYVYW